MIIFLYLLTHNKCDTSCVWQLYHKLHFVFVTACFNYFFLLLSEYVHNVCVWSTFSIFLLLRLLSFFPFLCFFFFAFRIYSAISTICLFFFFLSPVSSLYLSFAYSLGAEGERDFVFSFQSVICTCTHLIFVRRGDVTLGRWRWVNSVTTEWTVLSSFSSISSRSRCGYIYWFESQMMATELTEQLEL